jgi:hypothetical protein
MDERFTPEEWDTLTVLPFVVFTMVAAADGEIQAEEASLFVDQIRSTAFCADPLRRELSQTILASDFMELFMASKDATRWEALLERARRILRLRLSDAEYRAFLSSVVFAGLEVAHAAKDREGKPRQSQEEQATLIDLAERLGVSVSDLETERDDPLC